MTLACPFCTGSVLLTRTTCTCERCGHAFRMLLGIPDLRVPVSGMDFAWDWGVAQALASRYDELSSAELSREYWRARGETESRQQSRIDYIYRAEAKFRAGFSENGVLGPPPRSTDGRCLDVGCGLGVFTVASTEHFDTAVAVDLSMALLVLARKRLEELGRPAILVCASAEHLPFAGEQFDFVGMFDMIEHVADRGQTLQEVFRVTRAGGRVVCTTPNRFSLGGEPHVGLWGVGFLPRAWMEPYVRWRTGRPYRDVHVMSLFELRSLFQDDSRWEWTVGIDTVWDGEVETFGPLKRALARAYNAVVRLRPAHRVLLPVAPFFVVVGYKRA